MNGKLINYYTKNFPCGNLWTGTFILNMFYSLTPELKLERQQWWYTDFFHKEKVYKEIALRI